jgi:DNA replication protein DnaC
MYSIKDVKVRRRHWLQAAGLPPARIGWTLEDCSEVEDEIMFDVKSWIEKVKRGDVIRSIGHKDCGLGLFLWGTPGLGKTTIALSIIQEMMLNFPIESFDVREGNTIITPCYFSTFNDILNLKSRIMDDEANDLDVNLYSGILGECRNDAFNIRVLIIDDIGKEHAGLSGWQKNMLHHILRTRFNNGLPTIITTNIDIDDWAGLYGDATESFAHEAFVYLPLDSNGKDLRR